MNGLVNIFLPFRRRFLAGLIAVKYRQLFWSVYSRDSFPLVAIYDLEVVVCLSCGVAMDIVIRVLVERG